MVGMRKETAAGSLNPVAAFLQQGLEVDLSPDLDDALSERTGDLSETSAAGTRVVRTERSRVGPVRCVGEVERLKPHLQVIPFLDGEVAEQAEVELLEARP